MKTFNDLNNEMESVLGEINRVTSLLNDAREENLKAEALYDNNYAKSLLEAKVGNPSWTESRIKAMASVISYTAKLEAIKAESKYRRLYGELSALNSKLDALKEESYNLRAELKRLV